jgi:hypothetical protein
MPERNYLDNLVGVFGHSAALDITMWAALKPNKDVMDSIRSSIAVK